ncbi:MAG: C4-dicarboxylate ABC transporter [Acidobacteria bacterium]|nr:MAG: C4-dicarboxylate ABC transporter [Acidobacteriota bacterium]
MTRRLVLATILIAGLGAGAAGAAQLKIATLAPDGSFWMTEMRQGAKDIEEATDGRVKLRIYPGGTMGNDQAVLRKMRIGQLHGGMMTGQSLAEVTSDLQLYGLPFLFKSYDEVDAVRERMDATLIQKLEAKGYISFGLLEGGFAYIMSNKPTTNLADFKGQKAWLPEGDIIAGAIYDAAGLSPVPLPLSDVLIGLQTGLIDTVAGPPVAAVALQWFTRTKYLTDLPILYTYGSIVVSRKAFDKLDAGDQKTVREILGRVSSRLDDRTRTDNHKAREALAKQGIEFLTVDAAKLEQWHKVGVNATNALRKQGAVPSDLVEELLRHLEVFRQGNSAD